MGFSRQDYWSGLPFPSPEDLPDPGIEPWSPAWQADSLPFELLGSPLNCKGPPICDAQQVSFWPLTGNLAPTRLSAPLQGKHYLHLLIPGIHFIKTSLLENRISSLITLLAFMNEDFSLKLPRRVENGKVDIPPHSKEIVVERF